ncbi:DUF2141 domain-containing protein [Sphingomonas humi]|uniref:DUF2141 domain-containing protein n=1 Tax=Sphingomonas humi TaxID=335630 RepID=A0ABP7RWL3_9SPHN
MDKMGIKVAAALLAAVATIGAGAPGPRAGADLQVQLSGLRSAKGTVYLCLSANPATYLKCKDDPSSVSRSIPAGSAGRLDLGAVKAGTYALLVVHDENRNGKLDMMFGIPREGFGFSNNPAMKPRAPKWEEIRFTMPATATVQQVRVRYVL